MHWKFQFSEATETEIVLAAKTVIFPIFYFSSIRIQGSGLGVWVIVDAFPHL